MAIKKAIALLSGGLDSTLAIKVIQDQGIKVTGLSFKTPFFGAEKAEKAAKQLNIRLIVKNITPEYLKMLVKPKYGYGSGMNPCNDCHALMIKTAGDLMKKKGYDFIFTGEVLGERPFSQNRVSLDAVANLSGYKEYLLRPLCAKLLEITKPEQAGIVDRNRLLDIQGRTRKRQFELVKIYNIKEFENPAGGCLLTDRIFARKLRDLFENKSKPTLRDFKLLRVGRHLRLDKGAKLILGRNKKENGILRKGYGSRDILVSAEHVPGPACLLTGQGLTKFIKQACEISSAYSDAESLQTVTIYIKKGKTKQPVQLVANKEIKAKINWL